MKQSTVFLIIMILGLVGMAIMHERVHIEIYRSYGIDSHIEYISHFPDLVTVADGGCPTDECKLAHNINEAVSYPFIVFYLVLMLGLLSIIKVLEEE